MQLIQVVIVVFALWALSRAFLRYKDKSLSAWEMVFWSVVWLLVVWVGLSPDTPSWIAGVLGIGRPVDVLVYTSLLLLFYMIFRIYVKLDHHERQMTEVVRKVALKGKK
ncbi:MAG TPA: DUF2304 family protein [Candidatus Nanoarchaeia archaeon]|nr:DUF2304 family protein [Candidatus Nanoarchaeia archaeon]